jgi:4-hydroxybenzoate polyprenyltransferase
MTASSGDTSVVRNSKSAPVDSAEPGKTPPGKRATAHGGGARPIDYLFLLRPIILIPVWTFFLLGARHGMLAGDGTTRGGSLLTGLLSFTALLGAVYIANQIADRDTDRAGRKLFLIADGIIAQKAAWAEAGALVAISFGVAIAFLPRSFLAILFASLILGAAYSLEPVRFKKRPLFDVLANAAGNGVLNTLAGWTAIGAPLEQWEVLLPYPFAVASVHLTTTLADRAADARSGLMTSGVVLGARRGILVSTALMGAAAVAASIVGNNEALIASMLATPFFLFPRRSPHAETPPAELLLPAKAATLIFSMTAGFLFPVYIPFLVAVIALTRLYYAKRFGLAYPSLRSS